MALLEIEIDGAQKDYRMITIRTGDYIVVLKTNREDGIMYLQDKGKDLTSFQAIKKLDEVKNENYVSSINCLLINHFFLSMDDFGVQKFHSWRDKNDF